MTIYIHHASILCIDEYHDLCPGLLDSFTKTFLPDGSEDQVNCGCLCHPNMSGFCGMGRHDRCNAFGENGSLLCDCPCHFRHARAVMLDLRSRVTA